MNRDHTLQVLGQQNLYRRPQNNFVRSVISPVFHVYEYFLSPIPDENGTYTAGHGWGIFCVLDVNWGFLQCWPISHMLWKAQHFSKLKKKTNNSLYISEYGPLLDNMRWIHFDTNGFVTRQRLTTGLVVTNMKNDVFPLNSARVYLKILTLCGPIDLETSSVIYWNL